MIKGAPDGTERATVSGLVRMLQLKQSTITELVQRAEDAGLVRRDRSNADGRVVQLALTEEGDARLAASVAEHGDESRLLVELASGLRLGP